MCAILTVAHLLPVRNKMTQKTGGYFQVPYISDPNTGVDMFESQEIIKYLEQVYTP